MKLKTQKAAAFFLQMLHLLAELRERIKVLQLCYWAPKLTNDFGKKIIFVP